MEISTTIDNLILNVKGVKYEQWDNFIREVKQAFYNYEFERNQDYYNLYTKGTIRDYHYNLRVGSGGGAVFIGYQHNAEKPISGGFTMKLEFNPNKPTKEQETLLKAFRKSFSDSDPVIKGIDVAFDIEAPGEKIFVFSLTGRRQDRNRGTAYFGTRGKSGYLKVYDKKKELEEKQGVTVDMDHLTRVEYSLRLKDAISLSIFENVDSLSMNDLYKVHYIDSDEKIDPFMKAVFYSYLTGYQDLKEFSKYQRGKIKKALDSFERIDLDSHYLSARKDIVLNLKRLLVL